MKAVLMKVALAGVVAAPMAWLQGDDQKEQKSEKVEKRSQVKVLRLDGKDGENEDVRVLIEEADEQPAAKRSYLGVVIEPVPAALAAHLPDVLTPDAGLMVAEVADDSPAAKAGLKTHDVLLTYNDQKLFSGEQLTKLVRSEKVGQEVALGIVRAGKMETVKVAIGEHAVRPGPSGMPGRRPFNPFGPRRDPFRFFQGFDNQAAPGGKVSAEVKSSFSSMKLESLDGDRFKAEIEYKDESGDTLKRSFEGTREEIQKQIEADEEMPEATRKQLLRSMDIGKGAGRGGFRFNMPSGGFAFGFNEDDFPAFNWPASGDFDRVIEQLSDQIDPQLREKLKGAFRSIEEPGKRPVPRDGSL